MQHVFKVCAMLHNMLLDHDGYSEIGQEEAHWIDVDAATDDVRIAAQRAARRVAKRRANLQGRAAVLHVSKSKSNAYNENGDEVVQEKELGWNAKRSHLVAYFGKAMRRGQVKWLETASECVRPSALAIPQSDTIRALEAAAPQQEGGGSPEEGLGQGGVGEGSESGDEDRDNEGDDDEQ